MSFFFFQAEDGRRYLIVGRVQTCVLVFSSRRRHTRSDRDWSSDLVCRLLLGSEEHTSELQSRSDLVCRLLLEKKKTPHVISDTSAVALVHRAVTSSLARATLNLKTSGSPT